MPAYLQRLGTPHLSTFSPPVFERTEFCKPGCQAALHAPRRRDACPCGYGRAVPGPLAPPGRTGAAPFSFTSCSAPAARL